MLRRAGWQRNLTSRAAVIVAALRTEQLSAPARGHRPLRRQRGRTDRVITELARQTFVLEAHVQAGFGRHPDAEIDLHTGAELMYCGGDVVEITLAIVIALQWYLRGGCVLARAERLRASA